MTRRRPSKGGGRSNGRNGGRGRQGYARTDRVGELLREIIAEELIRIDDEDLAFVTVSGVEVDNELFRATVFLSTLDLNDDLDLEVIEAHGNRLKRAINNQARLRKIPELRFALDPGLLQGTRVDEILRESAIEEPAINTAANEMADSGEPAHSDVEAEPEQG